MASRDNPYFHRNTFTKVFNGEILRFISKPGIPNWDRITPSAALLINYTQLKSEDRVLFLGCGHGAVAPPIANQISDGELWATDNNIIATSMTRATLELNQITNTHIYLDNNLPRTSNHNFNVVMIDLPKGRKLSRRWILESFHALVHGGVLYISGANDLGVKSSIKDAELLFGHSTLLGYNKGNRIAFLTKPKEMMNEPDWIYENGIQAGTWHTFNINLFGENIQIHSLPGIFSYDRLDEGTELLLNNIEIPHTANVLDIGCGYGIIGLYAALSGAAHVDLVEANILAVAAANKNILSLDLSNATVIASDALNAVIDKKYELVLTNPPFHTEKI